MLDEMEGSLMATGGCLNGVVVDVVLSTCDCGDGEDSVVFT